MALKPGQKIDLKPKRHHGFYFLLFLMGLLLPPLAVATRFGIGTDFFINVFLCICGYFPCHFHNFYIQNIRNNTNRNRTPKWALKAGLVDDSDIQRKKRKNAWAKRFDERNLESTHVGAPLEEGEEGANYDPLRDETPEAIERRRNEGLWTRGDEEYYNEDQAPNQREWHYPMNFAGTIGDGRSKSRNTQSSTGEGDRWERSRSAQRDSGGEDQFYPTNAERGLDADVPEWGKDYGSKKKSKKSKKGGTASAWANNNYVQDVQDEDGWGRSSSRGSGGGGGRANGNGYGNGSAGFGSGGYDAPRSNGNANAGGKKKGGDIFEHEF